MQILDNEKISTLIQIGFAGCTKGQIFQARRLFEGLLCANPEILGAKLGLAFSHLVVDDFAKADELLDELMTKYEHDADVKAMKVFSCALQKQAEEAHAIADLISPEDVSAYQLCQDSLKLLDR